MDIDNLLPGELVVAYDPRDQVFVVKSRESHPHFYRYSNAAFKVNIEYSAAK